MGRHCALINSDFGTILSRGYLVFMFISFSLSLSDFLSFSLSLWLWLSNYLSHLPSCVHFYLSTVVCFCSSLGKNRDHSFFRHDLPQALCCYFGRAWREFWEWAQGKTKQLHAHTLVRTDFLPLLGHWLKHESSQLFGRWRKSIPTCCFYLESWPALHLSQGSRRPFSKWRAMEQVALLPRALVKAGMAAASLCTFCLSNFLTLFISTFLTFYLCLFPRQYQSMTSVSFSIYSLFFWLVMLCFLLDNFHL